MQEWLGFEGEFPDWNYELDLCVNCASEFKIIVDKFCDTDIDTNTKLTDEEKAEREPVSQAYKKLYGEPVSKAGKKLKEIKDEYASGKRLF